MVNTKHKTVAEVIATITNQIHLELHMQKEIGDSTALARIKNESIARMEALVLCVGWLSDLVEA